MKWFIFHFTKLERNVVLWLHWLQWGKHHGFVNDDVTWYAFLIISYFVTCLKYKIHRPQIHKFFIKFIYLMTLYVLSFTLGFIFPLENLENHRNKILLHRVLVTFFFLRLWGDIGTSSSTLPWALSKSMKVFE